MCSLVKTVWFSIIILVIFQCLNCVTCEESDLKLNDGTERTVQAVGEGRTYVHHFVKRLGLVMLPLMFKFGVVMTLLILISITSVNGLAVGIILMVLGLSHVLARAYQSSGIAASPVQLLPSPPAAYAYAPSFSHGRYSLPPPLWDRMDMKKYHRFDTTKSRADLGTIDLRAPQQHGSYGYFLGRTNDNSIYGNVQPVSNLVANSNGIVTPNPYVVSNLGYGTDLGYTDKNNYGYVQSRSDINNIAYDSLTNRVALVGNQFTQEPSYDLQHYRYHRNSDVNRRSYDASVDRIGLATESIVRDDFKPSKIDLFAEKNTENSFDFNNKKNDQIEKKIDTSKVDKDQIEFIPEATTEMMMFDDADNEEYKDYIGEEYDGMNQDDEQIDAVIYVPDRKNKNMELSVNGHAQPPVTRLQQVKITKSVSSSQ